MTTLVYQHPQGAKITVVDGVMVSVVDKNGKNKKTSATVEKLARGHGGWTLVSNSDNDIASFFPGVATTGPVAQTSPDRVAAPMRFEEGDVRQIGRYVSDSEWYLQQKVDGIRAVLDVVPGEGFSWRSSSGKTLVQSSAIPAMNRVLAQVTALAGQKASGYREEFSVDGEILNGVFYVFDFVTKGQEATPYAIRLMQLQSWHAQVACEAIQLLPTATSAAEKQTLVQIVRNQGGEGWMAKSDDSPYDWGGRVDHSVKLKITSTVDCLVLARDTNGKSNFTLGLWDANGSLVTVGQASAIGKPDVQVGGIVEVRYLYAGAGGKLVQPTVLRERSDKMPNECTTAQLRHVNKAVLTP